MKKLISLVVVLVLAFAIEAFASPQVSINITAKKEVVETKNGQKVKKTLDATTVEPGDVVVYLISYSNSGDEAATNVYLDDPIPAGTLYVPGSAYGANAKVLVSSDGGKTFKEEGKGEQYTHLRWVIGKIDAGTKGNAGFQVKVK